MSIHRHESPKIIDVAQFMVGGTTVVAPFLFRQDMSPQEAISKSPLSAIGLFIVGSIIAVNALQKIFPRQDPFHVD